MPVRLAPNEELPPPLTGYTLIERLGRGGFGEVWKVEAPGGFLKAAKFVIGDLTAIEDEESLPAEQEKRSLKRMSLIRHTFILSLERVAEIEGQLVLIMELAECNLWDRFRQCRQQKLAGIPREELLRYLEETAEALDFMADTHQIQHLDIKPQNIFIMSNHVKVADFGLAKDLDGDRATMTGGVTPVYAAPETFEGYVSRYTDQYSLGIVYQELLTGRRPFDGANVRHLMNMHLTGAPDLNPLPAPDRAVIERALAKTPTDRWPSCMDLVRALRQAGLPPVNPPTQMMPPTEKLARGRSDTPVPAALPPAPPPAPSVLAGVLAGAVARNAPPAPKPAGSGAMRTPASRPLSIPALITPKTAAGGGPAPARTLGHDRVIQTGRMSSLGLAPPEKSGDGVLFPALVVGVGGTGLAVLQALRAVIRDRYGHADAVPAVRFLYIDTDPDAFPPAMQGPDALATRDVVPARLARPTHYLQHSAAPPVESWLPPGLLYQLPKNPGSAAGVRAFGRLALCDHYRVIAQRIRQHLEPFLTDEILDQTGRETKLGVRSNRVRAYVVAGLGGGTGSGMAADLGYILKHELRGVGYRRPEAVGILLAPPADTTRTVAANTYAALAELHHLANGTRFQTRYDAADAPVTDPDGPFTRTAILPLPRTPRARDQRRVYAMAARALYSELLTPAGRVTDYTRQVAPVTNPHPGPAVQSFGLHRLSWSRPELLSVAAKRLAARQLQQWGARDAAHLREPLAAWLDDQWGRLGLAPDAVIKQFRVAVQEQLGEAPEAVFAAFVDTLSTRTPGAGRLDAVAAAGVFEQLLNLVGKPVSEPDHDCSLDPVLAAISAKIAADADKNLSVLAVMFIERPQYRLAGADEALAQLDQRLAASIEALEPEVEAIGREVVELYGTLFRVIGSLGQTSGLAAIPGRKAALTADLFEALMAYPERRLKFAEYSAALTLYRTLIGNIPDYVRDVNACRSRLARLEEQFAPPESNGPAAGTLILPAGCQNIVDAAGKILDELPPDDLLAFDQSLQADLRTRAFGGLAKVCSSEHRTDAFVQLMNDRSRAFLDERIERTDPASVLLRYRGAGPDLEDLLRQAYEAAAPALADVAGAGALEAAILGAPAGESGDQVRAAASVACPGDPFIPAPLPDDILVYREYPRVPLAALKQLGPVGFEAFQQQSALSGSPHARADIPWPRPPAAPP